jgi:DNA-binding CsgD family transcriptional regulator
MQLIHFYYTSARGKICCSNVRRRFDASRNCPAGFFPRLQPLQSASALQSRMSSQDHFSLKIAALARLSRRERQVLAFVVEGRTRSEIAADLHIAPKSIDTYLARILAKIEKTFEALSDLPPAPK